MSEIWYRVEYQKVTPVTVEKISVCTLTLREKRHWSGDGYTTRRVNTRGSHTNYFPTEAEALEYLRAKITERIAYLEGQLQTARSALGEVEAQVRRVAKQTIEVGKSEAG